MGQDTLDRETRILLDEWKECRNTIGRFDNIIVGIRKYGFSLLTGLLSADAFLFVTVEGMSLPGKVAVSGLMMILVVALFTVDRCHEVFIQGAVRRAEPARRRRPKTGPRTILSAESLS